MHFFHRNQEKEKDLQYTKDFKKNLQIALNLEREREKNRKMANELTAQCLAKQIETQARLRQENLTKIRQVQLIY